MKAGKTQIDGSKLYTLLIESVRDYAIFVLDPEGHVLSWNPGAQRIKGYSADEIIGKHFSIFYPQEDLDTRKPWWELEVAVEVGRFEDEGWRLRKDGSRFWANVIITTLRDQTGEVVGFAKVTRDLTERKKAEERAIEDARRLAMAEAANRTKSEFLATLSHELRTPLNAVAGYAELLAIGLGGPVSQQQLEFIERIRTSQHHLLGIINDLLNYSRIEAGQVTYDCIETDLHPVVERSMRMVTPQAARKEIQLTHGPCHQPLTGFVDEAKIEQILINLLSNAVKFTPEGGDVTVSCVRAEGGPVIEVRDIGPGVPIDKRESIFEPFVQLGRSLTSAQEGTGLGLAISRDLARGMRGDVYVQDTDGPGATFALAVPERRPA
jgi:PAS domain S-box-containing protein